MTKIQYTLGGFVSPLPFQTLTVRINNQYNVRKDIYGWDLLPSKGLMHQEWRLTAYSPFRLEEEAFQTVPENHHRIGQSGYGPREESSVVCGKRKRWVASFESRFFRKNRHNRNRYGWTGIWNGCNAFQSISISLFTRWSFLLRAGNQRPFFRRIGVWLE